MSKTNKTPQYVDLKRELDETLAQLQEGELGIDDSMTAYARGIELIAQLEARLKETENTIKTLQVDVDKTEED